MILEMFMASDGLKHKENKYESTLVQCIIVKFDLAIKEMQSP